MRDFLLRRRLLSVLLALLAAGCTPVPLESAGPGQPALQGTPGPGQPARQSTPGPAAQSPPAPAAEVRASALFPAQDLQLNCQLYEKPAAQPSSLAELLLRDGDRIVAVQNNKPYAVWHLKETGVWRQDPKGPAMLRFLPPVLRDGEIWSQKSGDAEVWFTLRLHREDGAPAKRDENRWDLAMVNRDERLTFTFSPGTGPTYAELANYQSITGSFRKGCGQDGLSKLSDAERANLLRQAAVTTAAEGPVLPGSHEGYKAAVAKLPGMVTAKANILGDGLPAEVRGPLGAWSTLDVEFAGSEPRSAIPLDLFWEEHRVSLVSFNGANRAYFLVERRYPGLPPTAQLQSILCERPGCTNWPFRIAGQDAVNATRVTADSSGLSVEWDMLDPAGHTRIQRYKVVQAQGGGIRLELETENFHATDGQLTYPSDPLGVLEAAMVAKVYGLTAELPRYFADNRTAAAFLQGVKIDIPYFELRRRVQIANSQPGGSGLCNPGLTPATPNLEGISPFAVTWGGTGGSGYIVGKVRFGKDRQGRTVIQEVLGVASCG